MTDTNEQVVLLEYAGINKHEGEGIGLFDTVLSANDCRNFEHVSK